MRDRKTDGKQDLKPNPIAASPETTAAAGESVPQEGLKKEYVIDIFRDWCKGCGICAEFCPRGCIKMNEAGQPVVERADRCTGCGWCELHCPDFAICVRELAASKSSEESED
ncbi:MAG: 4Fe-4S binding protein [Syntrophales bacterium]|nr:4Fe-4S binding protein [Syntrophales bacterium]MDD5642683.1 4Fe-4S binding protein [Syntrophales bacterium]